MFFVVSLKKKYMSKLVAENDIKDENWLNLPGEEKIREDPDSSWISASVFMLFKEDHTVANLLRMKLHTNKLVRFVGYKHPHPVIHNIEMIVQTAPIHITAGAGSSGPQNSAQIDAALGALQQQAVPTPAEAMLQALSECLADVDEFSKLWESEVVPKVLESEQQKARQD